MSQNRPFMTQLIYNQIGQKGPFLILLTMTEIEKSWNVFLEKPFPENCVGLEVESIELVSLDTFSAGCIDTFIANKGSLDAKRISTLKSCFEALDKVLKYLDGDAKNYFEHLRSLSEQVLKRVS
jgi:hypothetical protein